MEADIDVSGMDIFEANYTICVATKESIKGFKLTPKLINIIYFRYGQGFYRYKKSKKGTSLLKVRLYSVIIYYILKSFKVRDRITLNVCRDFSGKEAEIKSNLRYLLGELLKVRVDCFNFCTLGKDSLAHRYAYLMRKDTRNKLKTYVKIGIKDIERFLSK